jgi:hypothetical protein
LLSAITRKQNGSSPLQGRSRAEPDHETPLAKRNFANQVTAIETPRPRGGRRETEFEGFDSCLGRTDVPKAWRRFAAYTPPSRDINFSQGSRTFQEALGEQLLYSPPPVSRTAPRSGRPIAQKDTPRLAACFSA